MGRRDQSVIGGLIMLYYRCAIMVFKGGLNLKWASWFQPIEDEEAWVIPLCNWVEPLDELLVGTRLRSVILQVLHISSIVGGEPSYFLIFNFSYCSVAHFALLSNILVLSTVKKSDCDLKKKNTGYIKFNFVRFNL